MKLHKTLQRAFQMSDEAFKDEGAKYLRKQKAKILAYCSLAPKFAEKWFKIISQEEFKPIAAKQKRLFVKPFRVYISTKWSKAQRMQCILDTYRVVQKFPPLYEAVTAPHAVELALLQGKDFTAKLQLRTDDRFRKEGELVIDLAENDTQKIIYSLSFSFLYKGENVHCLAGCVQGAGNEAELKAAQKNMYGIRPKSFMVFALQEVARAVACAEIWGVSNKIQAHNQKHFIHIDFLHKLNFDYNQLWAESGAELRGDWYRIPLKYDKKPMAEIKSKKRAQYKRRYDFLDEISRQIQQKIKSV